MANLKSLNERRRTGDMRVEPPGDSRLENYESARDADR